MTSYLISAKHVHDIECDLGFVEIQYDRYIKGEGYSTYTDYISTEPSANWTFIESKGHNIPYEKFLDTMTKRTSEVLRRIVELVFESIMLWERDNKVYIRLINAIKILNPKFNPPRIDMNSSWQNEIVKYICEKYTHTAIDECINISRLEYFLNVLRIIEIEL